MNDPGDGGVEPAHDSTTPALASSPDRAAPSASGPDTDGPDSAAAASHVPGDTPKLRFPAPESLTKASAALALICFVSGLIVVQSYLYSLGFSIGDLSLLKTQLVYTGADFIGSIGFAVLCPIAAWQLVLKAKTSKATGLEGLADSAGALLALVILVLPWVLYLAVLGDSTVSSDNFGDALELYCLAAVAGFLVLAAILTAKSFSADSEWAFMALLGAMMVLGYVFWYASYFGSLLYPQIPQEYGGGRPVRAWLEAESLEKAAALGEMGVPFDSPVTPRRTKPLDLLYDNKDVLVVRPDGGPIIRVERSAIIALRTDNRHPSAVSVHTTNSGRPGIPEEGDVITFRYSESLDAGSLLPGWDGSPVPVIVAIQSSRTPVPGKVQSIGVGNTGQHMLSVVSQEGVPVAVGRVADYSGEVAASRSSDDSNFGTSEVPSTMSQEGSSVRIQLGKPLRTWEAGYFGNRWRWEPSTTARDLAGHECRSAVVVFEPSKTRPPLF